MSIKCYLKVTSRLRRGEEHNVSLAAFKMTAGYQFSAATACSSSSASI